MSQISFFQKYNDISKRILRFNHNEIFTNYIMAMIYMCRRGVDLGAQFSCVGQHSLLDVQPLIINGINSFFPK